MGDLLLPASSLSKRHQRLALDPEKIDIQGNRPGSKARQGFTAEQIAECKELFQIFDKDADGEIDRTEFLPMMKVQVLCWIDKFCSLSPLCCTIWIDRHTNTDTPWLIDSHFSLIKRSNADNWKALGLSLSTPELEMFFNRMDYNGDGSVQLPELVHFLEGYGLVLGLSIFVHKFSCHVSLPRVRFCWERRCICFTNQLSTVMNSKQLRSALLCGVSARTWGWTTGQVSLSRLVWNKSYKKPSHFSAQRIWTLMRSWAWLGNLGHILAVYKTSSFVFLSFFMLSTSATGSYIIKRDQQSAGFALLWQTCDCLKLPIVCWCFTNVVNLVVRQGKMMQGDARWCKMVRWCEMMWDGETLRHDSVTAIHPKGLAQIFAEMGEDISELECREMISAATGGKEPWRETAQHVFLIIC